VARFKDGRIIKGTTYDFGPQKKGFHVVPLARLSGFGVRFNFFHFLSSG
jgi:hypothetical protein